MILTAEGYNIHSSVDQMGNRSPAPNKFEYWKVRILSSLYGCFYLCLSLEEACERTII